MKPLLLVGLFLAGLLALGAAPACALGTVRVQQADGTVKIYTNVSISIADEQMTITSSDGKGTIVLGKAACEKVGGLIRCLPYDATLQQDGAAVHIALKSGTAWFNPSSTNQGLSHSSTQIPPHGVLLAAQTKAGTYVTLTGTVDRISK